MTSCKINIHRLFNEHKHSIILIREACSSIFASSQILMLQHSLLISIAIHCYQRRMWLTCADWSPDNNKRPTEANCKLTPRKMVIDRYGILVNLQSFPCMSGAKHEVFCLNPASRFATGYFTLILSNRGDKTVCEADCGVQDKKRIVGSHLQF